MPVSIKAALAFIVGVLVGWTANGYLSPDTHSGTPPQLLPLDAPVDKAARATLTRSREVLERQLVRLEDADVSDSGYRFVHDLVRSQAAIDPLGTARLIIHIGAGSKTTDLLRSVARVWYANDGLDILATLVASGPYDQLRDFYHPVFTTVVNEEPLTALPHVLALEDRGLRNRLFFNVAHAIQPRDVAHVTQVIGRLDAEGRTYVLTNTADQLAKLDPEHMLAQASQYSNAVAAMIHEAAARAISQTDPLRAIELTRTLDMQDPGGSLMRAVGVLAQSDPLTAKRIYETTENPSWQDRMIRPLSQGWARQDREGAARWVSTLDSPYAAEQLQGLAHEWGSEDLQGATAFAATLPDDVRVAWLHGVVSSYRHTDPQAYLRWLEQFQAEASYPALLSRAVYGLHRTHPETAIRFVRSLDASVGSESMAKLIDRVGEHDPRLASAWLEDIADDDVRAKATHSFIRDWQRRNLDEAVSWVSSLGEGALKDEATSALVIYSHSEALRPLATAIENRAIRNATLLSRTMVFDSARIAAGLFERLELTEAQWTRLDDLLEAGS